MDVLFPRIPLARLPAMLTAALLGAIVAGVYGALHDQISYSISPEYFSKLKFHQFWYADFGWGNRAFAAAVGFLASWWVGLIAAWLLARVGLARAIAERHWLLVFKTFAIVAAVTIVAGAAAAFIGVLRTQNGDLQSWELWQRSLDLLDLRGFVIVAHLHMGSYVGALLGFLVAAIYVRWQISSNG